MCDAHGKCGSCSGSATLPGGGKFLQYSIRRNGFGVVYAFAESPNFAYSAGIEESWNHPELIAFGLDYERLTGVITDAVALIREGASLAPEGASRRTLDGLEVMFIEVPFDTASRYLSETAAYYGQREFRVLQIVWPDERGCFPTDVHCSDQVKRLQPVLSQITKEAQTLYPR
jgi:hypothetical protein